MVKVAQRPATDTRRSGLLMAGVAAIVSGCAVFINGYGVDAWSEVADATTYTTLKNLVAALVLVTAAAMAGARGSRALTRPTSPSETVGLVVVAVVGGAAAFALFFEGLQRASSTQSAFIHKTLVVWVAILAVGLLRESLKPFHVAAIALIVAGQFVLVGSVDEVAFGTGEIMVLAATLLWSVEVVVAKRLLAGLSPLTVGVARMGGGAAVLVAYGLFTGGLASMGAVTFRHVAWVVVTGVVLAVFVGSWFTALSRASAIDVTAVLVGGAVVTAFLRAVVSGNPLEAPLGLGMVAAGVALVAVAGMWSGSRRQPAIDRT